MLQLIYHICMWLKFEHPTSLQNKYMTNSKISTSHINIHTRPSQRHDIFSDSKVSVWHCWCVIDNLFSQLWLYISWRGPITIYKYTALLDIKSGSHIWHLYQCDDMGLTLWIVQRDTDKSFYAFFTCVPS